MKISIVTISFNQSRYLGQCLSSIQSQDYPDLEHIVVDPGSTDGSREMVLEYGDRIVKVFEPDRGAADGLNKGFEHATGEIFGYINSDDELLPSALRTVATFFEAHPDVDMVMGCGYLIDENGKRLRKLLSSKMTLPLFAYNAVAVFQQCAFFRREIFHKAGGFNIENRTCWDGELYADMALAGARFKTIPTTLALFRLHSESITGSGRFEEQFRLDGARIFEKITHRPFRRSDHIRSLIGRKFKFLVNPSYLYRRFLERS